MGNSESSPQIPAGADGRRGVGRRNNSEEEENDATNSSTTSIEAVAKVGAAVAATALVAWGAWNSEASSRSEHPEDDRRRNERVFEGICEAGRMISRGSSSGGRGFGNDGYHYQPEKNYQKINASRTIKFMTYNVWKQEVTDRFGRVWPERIEAIARLVEEHDPDVIFFQLSKLRIESKSYVSSKGRKMPTCELDAGFGRRLLVANGHLKCHNSPAEINREIRKTQAKAILDALDNASNAVFGGDMNWNGKKDGSFPLPEGWVDAWTYLKGSDDGWTYNTKSNEHLKDRRVLQERLDRFVCKLSNFRLTDIELIGTEAEPPSDHYGLLLTICSK